MFILLRTHASESERSPPDAANEPAQRPITQRRGARGEYDIADFNPRDLHPTARDQHRFRTLYFAHRRNGEKNRQGAEKAHAPRVQRDILDIAESTIDVVLRRALSRIPIWLLPAARSISDGT
jgi:hypothetical protein